MLLGSGHRVCSNNSLSAADNYIITGWAATYLRNQRKSPESAPSILYIIIKFCNFIAVIDSELAYWGHCQITRLDG